MFFLNVSESPEKITVFGISNREWQSVIKSKFPTTRILAGMFQYGHYKVEFYKFFLPDVLFMLEIISKEAKFSAIKLKASKILELLKTKTYIAAAENNYQKLNLDRLKDLNYTPLDYQLEFFKYYSEVTPKLRLNGALLAAAAGSGKSFQGLSVAHCLDADKVIIICPLPAVTRVWEDQILKVFKQRQSYHLSTSSAGYNGERFRVVHYEALQRIEQIIEGAKGKKLAIILDECHNLNDIKSQRTQLFIELCKRTHSKDIIFASGTPVKAAVQELLPLFKAIDPLFTDKVEHIFKLCYAGASAETNRIINYRLSNVSFKVEKKELKLDAPTFETIKVTVPGSDKYTLPAIREAISAFITERKNYYKAERPNHQAEYDRCLKIFASQLTKKSDLLLFSDYQATITKIIKAHDSGSLMNVPDEIVASNKYENGYIIPALSSEDRKIFKEVKTIIKYTKLKIQGECLGRILGRIRIDCHVDIAKHVDFSSIIDNALLKTVIFSSYVDVCEQCKSTLDKDYITLSVYGQYTKNLSSIVNQFERNQETNPLIATYASLSTAVPLIMANTVIMINPPFRDYIQNQAISRVHRLGAKEPVFIYQTVLDTGDVPNISTRGIDIIAWSQQQVEEITGVASVYKDTIINESGELSIASESLDYTEVVIATKSKSLVAGW